MNQFVHIYTKCIYIYLNYFILIFKLIKLNRVLVELFLVLFCIKHLS
jgi:hypothetical protein